MYMMAIRYCNFELILFVGWDAKKTEKEMKNEWESFCLSFFNGSFFFVSILTSMYSVFSFRFYYSHFLLNIITRVMIWLVIFVLFVFSFRTNVNVYIFVKILWNRLRMINTLFRDDNGVRFYFSRTEIWTILIT